MGESLSKFEYGIHETGIHTFSWNNCKKRKTHEKYKDLDKFKKEDLPKGFQTDDVLELTMLLADLTVLLKVNHISTQRKDKFWQTTTEPYPISDHAGEDFFTTGTGRIWDVFHRSKRPEFNNATCPCEKCENEPNRDAWIVKVYTATHVVFDTVEAKKSKCILFYDSDTPKLPETKIYGLKTVWTHEEGDLCILFCVTCDENIKDILTQKNARLMEIWRDFEATYKNKMKKNRLAIIVSHPHGSPKKISVGLWRRRVKIRPYVGEHLFVYKLSTCPGSSGAPVFILGSNCIHSAYCHSGSSEKHRYSYSTRWLNKKSKKSKKS